MRRNLVLAALFVALAVLIFSMANPLPWGFVASVVLIVLLLIPDAKKPPVETGGSRSDYTTGISPAPAEVPNAINDAGSPDRQS